MCQIARSELRKKRVNVMEMEELGMEYVGVYKRSITAGISR
jgi:hypothetical protein